MNRRAWLVAFLGLLLVAATHAQPQRRRPRIGVLLPGAPEVYAAGVSALREGLAERGYMEPATLELVVRFSDGPNDRLARLARELVAAEVDIIVTSSTPAIRAAMSATSTIPIVFAAVADAVGSGLVASLARPGGNVTGLTLLIPDLGAKQLELLGEIVPGLQRVGVMRGRGEGAQAFETITAALSARGLKARFVEINSRDEIASAFAEIEAARSQALIVVDGPLLNGNHVMIANRAAAHRLPTISTLRVYVDAGSLACYGPNTFAMWRRAATHYVDRILKGAKPADLPVEQPTKFELVINLKAAKALGLTIPQKVLLRADALVE
ncbi:MAG: ABC transporter substrate-binding protein [Burkholderiales bacterium]